MAVKNKDEILEAIKTRVGDNTDDETIRVYIECVRSLYYNCNSAGKKKLSYLFKMIPWINKKYNVLCTEINETDSFPSFVPTYISSESEPYF